MVRKSRQLPSYIHIVHSSLELTHMHCRTCTIMLVKRFFGRGRNPTDSNKVIPRMRGWGEGKMAVLGEEEFPATSAPGF